MLVQEQPALIPLVRTEGSDLSRTKLNNTGGRDRRDLIRQENNWSYNSSRFLERE
ncbi:hypothetical protein F511_08960 [Dorcoceras hygrometricum]|uniref:Uncharacterized protein n=1 Tax=Dorcoceras hygrometricum TaxID=472368 RepID=A0A2Z7CYA1_9LAMI|nr:hypothetical protein F511_08960 [Dorcoceras hygrometricum]